VSAAPQSYSTHVAKDQPKKRTDIAAIITAGSITAVIAIAVAIYLFLTPGGTSSETPAPAPSPGGQQPVVQSPEQPVQPPPPPATPAPLPTDPLQTQDPEVSAVHIMYEGSTRADISIKASEGLYLYASIEPYGVITDVLWESSDPGVLQAEPVHGSDIEVYVYGIAPGDAVLTVTAGNLKQTCLIRVLENQVYTPMHLMLRDAIDLSIDGVVISIEWTSGRHRGNSTVFERLYNSNDWIMYGVSDTREVFPTFGYAGDAFTIGFPTTTRIYYLFEDGTGYFRNTDGTNNENLKWEYWIY